MIKISTVVSEIVLSSEFAVEGLRTGCLNLSAYADRIYAEVEQEAKKPVTKSSIVIALSRLAKELANSPSLVPTFTLENLSTTSGLIEASFSATSQTRKRLMALQADPTFDADHFMSVATGMSEVSIVASAKDKNTILKGMRPHTPRSLVEGLAAIRVHIDQATYNTPNVLYSLLKILSLSQINILNFTAVFGELTFIVRDDDVKRAFLLLHDHFLTNDAKK